MADLKIVEKTPEEPKKLGWKVTEVVMNDIISRLHKAKVIAEPQMKFIYNDRGVMKSVFDAHMTDPEIDILRKTKPDMFLMIMSVHSMGAGMMVIYTQKEKGKTLGHFTDEEVADMISLFKAYDVYQLACQKVGAEPGSQIKNYLDTVAKQGAFLARREAGEQVYEEEVLKDFAQAMFNLGVTIALG
ncbi:MAG: hypothetical protein KBS66_00840 [Eubacterium sp.]|nr:hypothetical protein [Candidatus Colimonas fimequi]